MNLEKFGVLILQGQLDRDKSECTFRLEKGRISIGSASNADVQLSGKEISPIHAVIELGAEPKIYDLASESGIHVNGQKVVSQVLKKGDQIRIGKFELKFFLEDEASPSSQSKDQAQAVESLKEERRVGGMTTSGARSSVQTRGFGDNEEVEEIFDFGPTQTQALEIVMTWRGLVVAVEHFSTDKTVSIGPNHSSDFLIPNWLTVKKFGLVTRSGGSFSLNIDPNMDGVIHREGKLETVQSLRDRFKSEGKAHRIVLDSKDFAKITVGEIAFYMSFSQAPPRLKRRRLWEKDSFRNRVVGTSVALSLLLMVWMLNLRVTETLEVEELPDRIATILYQPEKYSYVYDPTPPKKEAKKPETQPKIAPSKKKSTTIDFNKGTPKKAKVGKQAATKTQKKARRAERQAKAGKGARAKGKVGTRGSPKAAKGKVPQNQARRASPRGKQGLGGGQSQVASDGNIDALKGFSTKFQNLLSSSTSKLGKSGKKVKGFGGFDTRGSGGLALSGGGTGGGGSAESLGGLSDKGSGGARVGTGLGAAGAGTGIAGGSSRVILRTGGPEETVVMGAIDPAAVEAALLAYKDEFRYCYEREINAGNPKLSGRVQTSFVIGARGRVTRAGIESSTLKNIRTERCILKVIKRVPFPKPKGGGIVQVKYPFKFRPIGSG